MTPPLDCHSHRVPHAAVIEIYSRNFAAHAKKEKCQITAKNQHHSAAGPAKHGAPRGEPLLRRDDAE